MHLCTVYSVVYTCNLNSKLIGFRCHNLANFLIFFAKCNFLRSQVRPLQVLQLNKTSQLKHSQFFRELKNERKMLILSRQRSPFSFEDMLYVCISFLFFIKYHHCIYRCFDQCLETLYKKRQERSPYFLYSNFYN